ncbi:MAG: hypothetical protein QOJ64_503 [Acidobacteriota bacterium]|jgi:hypothetical protein|nr:hypothetical protein [Acidobacteriota bacterium]
MHLTDININTRNSAATMWQPCLGLSVGRLNRMTSLRFDASCAGSRQGQTESKKGSAIRDQRYLRN